VASADLADLEGRLGYRFGERSLLERALTHRSWCAEHPGHESNERLEFLGDAVLGWVVADLAYHRYADLAEGRMTDLRKAVVSADALADLAREIDLGRFLRLGRGEDLAGGRDKASILSDAFEATLAAVYVDGGATAAFEAVHTLVADALDEAAANHASLDYKTRLQESLARQGRGVPVYEASSEGPDHNQVFAASVSVDGVVLGEGRGRSKKRAEQAAAAAACRMVDGPTADHA
jgi:ribonuclease III